MYHPMLGKRLHWNTHIQIFICYLSQEWRIKGMIKGLLLICSYLLIYSLLSVLGVAFFIIQIHVCLFAVLGIFNDVFKRSGYVYHLYNAKIFTYMYIYKDKWNLIICKFIWLTTLSWTIYIYSFRMYFLDIKVPWLALD